jgi:hypothetical protein
VRELTERDNVNHAECCRSFRDEITVSGEDILDVRFFKVEECFRLSGYVNSQNSRAWSAVNPHKSKDTLIHDQKVGS